MLDVHVQVFISLLGKEVFTYNTFLGEIVFHGFGRLFP